MCLRQPIHLYYCNDLCGYVQSVLHWRHQERRRFLDSHQDNIDGVLKQHLEELQAHNARIQSSLKFEQAMHASRSKV